MRYAAALVLGVLAVAGVGAGADSAEECWFALQHENWEAALTPCTTAAKQGLAGAQNVLGRMYLNGQGVPKDDEKSVEWFTKAAEQGHAEAQHNLGLMYRKGKGVPQIYAKAVEWFSKSADKGFAMAQAKLGMMYETGVGVTKNVTLAHMWFNIASVNAIGAKDQRMYGEWRDHLEAKMTAEDVAEAEQLASEWIERHLAHEGGN